MKTNRFIMTFVSALTIGLAYLAYGPNPSRFARGASAGVEAAAPVVQAPPLADYGDAPDNDLACQGSPLGSVLAKYPTQFGTANAMAGRTAPYHTSLGAADYWLGGPPSQEAAAIEAISCDWITGPPCDFDDGALTLFLPTIGAGVASVPFGPPCGEVIAGCWGPCVPGATDAVWLLEVTRGPASTQPGYVNVVVDFNMNGRYGDIPGEWVLQNESVTAAPGGTQLLITGPFPVVIVPLPTGGWSTNVFWTRAMVSPEKIALPAGVAWDGSGQVGGYKGGETEDWVVECDPGEDRYAPRKPNFDSAGQAVVSLDPNDPNCERGFTVNLTSRGRPLSMLREVRPKRYVNGQDVITELVQLDLAGSDARAGEVILRERSDRYSFGKIDQVRADANGNLASGHSFFDVFVELELPSRGLKLDTGAQPLRFDAGTIRALPPIGGNYESQSAGRSVPLFVKGTSRLAGWLCRAHFTPTRNATATAVSAAGYREPVARDSIVALFGGELSREAQTATSRPLPTMLAGTRASIKDSAGREHLAGFFSVAPTQANLYLPPETATGPATVTITSGDGTVSQGTVEIADCAPGLFAANANGRGVAAGSVLRVRADGSQRFESLAERDPAQGGFICRPIDLGPESDQVFLVLYGTGLRYCGALSSMSATVGGLGAQALFAGPQGFFFGLDQINLRLSRSLIGRGEVDVVLTAGGRVANNVRVCIR